MRGISKLGDRLNGDFLLVRFAHASSFYDHVFRHVYKRLWDRINFQVARSTFEVQRQING